MSTDAGGTNAVSTDAVSTNAVDADAGGADAERMVRAMCAAADADDAEAFASYFGEAAYFRFGNGDPLIGRVAIAEATAATVSATYPTRHRVDQVVEVGSQVFCRFTILTTRPDGEVLDLPCVTVIGMAGGEIVDYRVHMDISPALVEVPHQVGRPSSS